MRAWQIAVLSGALFQLTACGSGSWVHPNKPPEEFTRDYNACEDAVIKDPKLQMGNNFLVLQATERCVMKKGWRLREQE